MSGTKHCVSLSPACPLELQSTSINRVLVEGVCKALPPAPLRALLRFDFSLWLEAMGCFKHSLPTPSSRVPFRVMSQGLAKSFENGFPTSLLRSARRREKGPQPIGWGGERASSPSTQIAQKNHTAGEREARAGLCFTHPASEDGIFQSEVRRKGVAGDTDTQCCVTRHVYRGAIIKECSLFVFLKDV